MSFETITTAVEDGGVGVIGLDRLEKRNALDAVMHREMLAARGAWEADDAVSCLMLIATRSLLRRLGPVGA